MFNSLSFDIMQSMKVQSMKVTQAHADFIGTLQAS